MIDHALNPYAPPLASIDSAPIPAQILTAATPRSRLAAFSIDVLLLLPLFAGLAISGTLAQPPTDAAHQMGRGATALFAVTSVYFAALVVYQMVMLARRGQTVGKRVMKIRIVKMDGAVPGFVQAVLLRMIVSALPRAIPVVGHLYTLIDLLFIFRADRRCLHDRIAGTRVVQA